MDNLKLCRTSWSISSTIAVTLEGRKIILMSPFIAYDGTLSITNNALVANPYLIEYFTTEGTKVANFSASEHVNYVKCNTLKNQCSNMRVNYLQYKERNVSQYQGLC